MTTEQYRTRSGLSIFLSFFSPHRGLFFLDLACALVVALIDLAYPIVSRYAMRTLLPQNAYRAFFTVMLVVVAAYALRALLYLCHHLLGPYVRHPRGGRYPRGTLQSYAGAGLRVF